jgi:hypothetical protein
MKIISMWNEAPLAVKWTSLLWLAVGIAGVVSGLHSLLTFLSVPVSGMTGIVTVEVGLQVGVAILVVLAAWRLLTRASWGRVILEIASWVTLIYYAVIGIIWIGAAVFSWDEFKASIAAELPQVDPTLKLIVGACVYVLPLVVSVIVIRVLRSSTVRRYVSSSEST